MVAHLGQPVAGKTFQHYLVVLLGVGWVLSLSVLLVLSGSETSDKIGCSITRPLGYWQDAKFLWINPNCAPVTDVLDSIHNAPLPEDIKILLIGDSHAQRMVQYACKKINAPIHHWLNGHAIMFSKSVQRRVRRKVHHWCSLGGFTIANLYHFGYLKLNGSYFNQNGFSGQATDTQDKILVELQNISQWIPNFSPQLVVLGANGYDGASLLFPPALGLNQKKSTFAQRLVAKTPLLHDRARMLLSLPLLTRAFSQAAFWTKIAFPDAVLAWTSHFDSNLLGPFEPEFHQLFNNFVKHEMAKNHPAMLLFDVSAVLQGRHYDFEDLLHYKPEFYQELINLYIMELKTALAIRVLPFFP